MPGPSGVWHRRPEHGNSSLSIPLPSITHPSSGVAEGEAVRQHIPGNRPALASPVMVPWLNQSLHGSSPVPPTAGRSGSGPFQKLLGSPQSRFVPIQCLAVVREHLHTAGFSASTVEGIAFPQRDSTGCLYNAKWEQFCRWCHGRKVDPVSADMPVVAEFLEYLFQRTPPSAIDTIRGYHSPLSSTLYNVVDLTNSVFLRNLLKNMDLQHPRYKELCPKWYLALVLAYITSPPFEPIMKASLCHLTLKTVFLLNLASGRRRNELHALSCDEKWYRFRVDGSLVTLITEPGFLAKNQTPQDSAPQIVIPALGPAVSDHPTGSCVLSGCLRLTWIGLKNRRSVEAGLGCSLTPRSLTATFHRRTYPPGLRN